MAISEKKMRIVINNYFKTECDVNTSIRQAFEKGFRIGVKKGPSAQPEPAIPISWIEEEIERLESRKNCLTVIDVAQLKAHIKRWESEQNE